MSLGEPQPAQHEQVSVAAWQSPWPLQSPRKKHGPVALHLQSRVRAHRLKAMRCLRPPVRMVALRPGRSKVFAKNRGCLPQPHNAPCLPSHGHCARQPISRPYILKQFSTLVEFFDTDSQQPPWFVTLWKRRGFVPLGCLSMLLSGFPRICLA
jgi:hypothetical protein